MPESNQTRTALSTPTAWPSNPPGIAAISSPKAAISPIKPSCSRWIDGAIDPIDSQVASRSRREDPRRRARCGRGRLRRFRIRIDHRIPPRATSCPSLRKTVPILTADVSGRQSSLLGSNPWICSAPPSAKCAKHCTISPADSAPSSGTPQRSTGARQAMITLGKQGLVTFSHPASADKRRPDWTPCQRISSRPLQPRRRSPRLRRRAARHRKPRPGLRRITAGRRLSRISRRRHRNPADRKSSR